MRSPVTAVAACAATASSKDGVLADAYVVPEIEYPPAIPEMRYLPRERCRVASGEVRVHQTASLTDTGNRPAYAANQSGYRKKHRITVAPRNVLETALANIGAEILGLPRVGVIIS
jgi:hypothetical protein